MELLHWDYYSGDVTMGVLQWDCYNGTATMGLLQCDCYNVTAAEWLAMSPLEARQVMSCMCT